MAHTTPDSPLSVDLVPPGTRSLFNAAPLYLAVGDHLDELLSGLSVECLQTIGAPQTGVILAMTTIFQFAEGLSSHQAADALRTRPEWKYALHLAMDYPGVECAQLDEFLGQLQANPAGQRVFQDLLARLEAVGLWRRAPKGATPLTTGHVLSSVEALNRLEQIVRAMRAALQALAARHPEWLLAIIPPYWVERYDSEPGEDRLPTNREHQEALMRTIEADVSYLLEAIKQADLPDLAMLPEVRALQPM